MRPLAWPLPAGRGADRRPAPSAVGRQSDGEPSRVQFGNHGLPANPASVPMARRAATLRYGTLCSSCRRRCPLTATTAPSTSAETLGRALEE